MTHQELGDADVNRRLGLCLWAFDKVDEDNFYDIILFSDESTFHKNGLVNRHNFRYYSDENLQSLRTLDHLHRRSVNVWGGILRSHVIVHCEQVHSTSKNVRSYVSFVQHVFFLSLTFNNILSIIVWKALHIISSYHRV